MALSREGRLVQADLLGVLLALYQHGDVQNAVLVEVESEVDPDLASRGEVKPLVLQVPNGGLLGQSRKERGDAVVSHPDDGGVLL